ncbi:helix-turn-helix transcriptional regulator [Nocardioides pantholopis]|uniref:helix-turn-helix transcriptional regulator n=1 Tax=Nocardioides pantholopis TaxID=2483798 RepID=UPI000FD77104|nr:response regulator transcription factor [Nocardioides pantholopis]
MPVTSPVRPPTRSAQERPGDAETASAASAEETSERLRVLVAAEQPLVAESVRTALVSQGFEAAAAPVPRGPVSGHQVGQIAALAPDVLLVISDLDRPSRLEGACSLIEELDQPAVVLAGTEDLALWGAVLEAGAQAVLSSSQGLREVARVLRATAAGTHRVAPEVRERLTRSWRAMLRRRYELAERVASLSPREQEVLELLYQGVQVQAIAARLQISPGTVRSQVRAILRKLDVNSQLAAVAAYAQLRRLGQDP